MTFSRGLKKIASDSLFKTAKKTPVPPSKLKELLALTGGVTLGVKTLPKEE